MSGQILISVIIPFYNAEKHLEKCVQNILSQTFKKNFEVIMIDDASLDNSYKIAQKFVNEKFLLFKLNSNSGPSAARNIGLKNARDRNLAPETNVADEPINSVSNSCLNCSSDVFRIVSFFQSASLPGTLDQWTSIGLYVELFSIASVHIL